MEKFRYSSQMLSYIAIIILRKQKTVVQEIVNEIGNLLFVSTIAIRNLI